MSHMNHHSKHHMMHKSGPQKYNKVNQQKKFHLLTLIYKERMPIREAAELVGINYLTAKTIVFFHKNNYKSYQFEILNKERSKGSNNLTLTASYVNVRKISALTEKLIKPKTRIQVICSIGNVLTPPVGCRAQSNKHTQVEEIKYAINEVEGQGLFMKQNQMSHQLQASTYDWHQRNEQILNRISQQKQMNFLQMSMKSIYQQRHGQDMMTTDQRQGHMLLKNLTFI